MQSVLYAYDTCKGVTEKGEGQMTQEEAKLDALQKHPCCKYAEVRNGLSAMWNLTWVVLLWRNEECYLEGDPPKHTVEGYPAR